MENNKTVRLNKFIANHSSYSRREVDKLIESGRVRLNNEVVEQLGIKVDLNKNLDIIVNGKPINNQVKDLVYLVLNKPSGYTVTKANFKKERNIMQLLPENFQHLNPVGRLDKQTTGLLLLTNDGDLLYQLTHPKFQHEKEYLVTTRESLTSKDLSNLSNGVDLEEGNTGMNEVTKIDKHTFSIILKQGWNRQIRRMVKALGKRVKLLQRVRMGKVKLGNLPEGKWQVITKADIC